MLFQLLQSHYSSFHLIITCIFQCDIFEVEAIDLEDLTKVVIGHDGQGMGAGWFLDRVVVKEVGDARDKEAVFPCHRLVLLMCGLFI